MLSYFKPDYYAPSLFEIPIDDLKTYGIKGLIIDLDNTLTNWNTIEISKEVTDWLDKVQKKGFKVCVVSNNSFDRINNSLEGLGIPFVANALKPSKKSFVKAMKIIDTNINNTAVIGDQLFTDIFGGKRVGITTVLVLPISNKEFIGTKFVRLVEKIIIKTLY
ncbi:hypothetical protein SAMN00017405_0255 [Desulfonispora thiosulfatigenes DSM 11270]|uniref:YqeG family HAD IIIA-type phosphatase n=1 Tax=Desulfonispora thiosulfatigenes DSM 11270 TaxID=656914 RepID=A0A1W1VNP1_DESTI|nr:YqeG family HAD IIIA-type phosphatase [Desulfonispora thiosulfatigenes]SMB94681.1 hypothetical protein SAMN00017405_0255 [Desulfonispora thiosulfatigenes DSM 11270]